PATGTISGPICQLTVRFDRCFDNREYEPNLRAFTWLALDGDCSMMRQNRLPRDSEPKPCATGLTCDIRFPDVFDSLGRNPAPRIPYPDRYGLVAIEPAGLDGHLYGAPRPAGVNGI